MSDKDLLAEALRHYPNWGSAYLATLKERCALAARVEELEEALREVADWNAWKANAAGGIGVREFARVALASQATKETT